MAENSAIEWTHHTFNGWIGCTKVGPGCDHCYAEQLATTRLQVPWGPGAPRRRTAASTWAKPRRWNRNAAAEGRRYRVFCSSLADVFDNEVPAEWRADLFALIRATPNLDWLLVTKRIGNAAKMAEAAGGWPLNVWLGATIVNQAEADRDIFKLRQTRYDAGLPVAFLSMEPLLGPVDIRRHLWPAHGWWKGPHSSYAEAKAAGAECGMKPQALLSAEVARSLVNWVIVGGESGSGARPMHPDWARGLRDQCSAAGVPFLFKQWGEWLPWEPDVLPYFRSQAGELIDRHALPDFHAADLKGWTDALMYEGGDVTVHQRLGKTRAGRLLDGVQHDGYPTSSGGEPEAAPVTDLDAPAPVRAGERTQGRSIETRARGRKAGDPTAMNQAVVAEKPHAPRARREVLKLGSKPPRPAADTPPAPIAAVLVPSAPKSFPLGRLMRAAENVRHTRVDEGCEELADDIVAHGLLQSLIGYELDGKVEIVGGGRRLRALRIVKARGLVDDEFPVPVLIRGVDEAVELSLAENLQQRTMSPVDEFFAFSELMKRGDTSPAELAKRFGFSERVVKQRLRLAGLAKPVLEALADRTITLDAAMAYATSQDTVLQEEVFTVQSKRGRTAHEPSGIRHSLRIKGIDTADPLFRFVGAVIYERDGGGYEDDLFVEPGKDRVLNRPFVLETAANRMVDFQTMRLIEELKQDEAWAPTIVGHIKVPDLRLHSWGSQQTLRPPAGFVLVERADHARMWRTIRNNGFNVHVVVGINAAGELIADPRYAFVPAAQRSAIEKPSVVDMAENQERTAASNRELEIIRWSRRLAVHPFAGTPYEGRAFWPDLHADRQIAATINGVDGFMVGLQVFVTQDEAIVQRKAAIALVDERAAARAVQA